VCQARGERYAVRSPSALLTPFVSDSGVPRNRTGDPRSVALLSDEQRFATNLLIEVWSALDGEVYTLMT
jgi:hypothetical protein